MADSETDVAVEVECIRKVQQGATEEFAFLVERYKRRVFSIVFHLVRRGDAVDDLAQEIFFKAFRAIRNYTFQSSFATWLSRIAVNHCYDYLRKVRASRVTYHWEMSEESVRELERKAESTPLQGLDHEEETALRELTEKLLERAPEEDRRVLVLKEIEGYSVEEIAGVMNLKVSTVKVRLHRARRRMLTDLQRWREKRR